MNHFALAAAAIASAGTLLAAPAAVAAPGHGTGGTLLPTSRAPHNSTPAKAPAKAVPATAYNGVCGSGYGVIDSLPISTLGTVYLTYNNATGKNCVVTVRATSGAAVYMAAAIQLTDDDSSQVVDDDFYTTYAGPVYLSAAGQCIDWAGQIANVYTEEDASHCG